MADSAAKGRAYGNLGNAPENLGDFRKAIACYERHLKIAREVGSRHEKGSTYGNLTTSTRKPEISKGWMDGWMDR